MKKYLKKCASFVLALSLCVGNIAPAFADEEIGITNDTIMNNEETKEVVEDDDSTDIISDGEAVSEEKSPEEANPEKENESIDKSLNENPPEETEKGAISESNIEKSAAILTDGEKEVSDSGVIGTATWTIYDDNTATISKGAMTGREVEYKDGKPIPVVEIPYKDLVNFTGELTIKDGVVFPVNSGNLFDRYKANKIKIENSTDNVNDMSYMFSECRSLKELELGENFNTGSVTDMQYMFNYCKGLTKLDLGKFKTEGVEDMKYMFHHCEQMESLDVSIFNTKNVTDMERMFSDMKSLKSLNLGKNFYTSIVKNMYGMFASLENIKELDFGVHFDSSLNTNYNDMFFNDKKLEMLDLSKWTIPDGTNLERMFSSTNLHTLRLGKNVKTIAGSDLPERNLGEGYTGKWVKETDHKDDYDRLEDENENPMSFDTSDLFMSGYNPDNKDCIGTYVRECEDYDISYDKGEGDEGSQVPQGTNNAHVIDDYQVLFDPLPTRTGYAFDGWKDEERDSITYTEGGNNSFRVPVGGATLTAQWKANNYKVTFDKNGGAGEEMPEKGFTCDDTEVDLSENSYEKAGYTFDGWNIVSKPGEGDPANFNSLSGEDLFKHINEEGTTILYAQWKANNYKVTFDKNGGAGEEMSEKGFTCDDTEVDLSENSYEKEGYTFDGWNIVSKPGEGDPANFNSLSGEDLFKHINEEGTTILYAQWKANNYKVTFDKNGGAGEEMSEKGFTCDDTEVDLSENSYEKEGYTFDGWNIVSKPGEGDPANFNSLSGEDLFKHINEEGTTILYAQWKANNYKVAFNKNGGAGEEMPEKGFTCDDTEVDLSENSYEKEGYRFDGWNIVSKPGEGDLANFKNLSGEDLFKHINEEGTTILYAQWKANNYKVAFNKNGGAGEEMPEKGFTCDDTEVDLSENSYEKAGYRFDGWNIVSKPGEGDLANFNSLSGEDLFKHINEEGTTIIYAQWKANAYTVVFDSNYVDGPEQVRDEDFTYDTPKDITKDLFTRDDYILIGWNTKKDNTGDFFTNGEKGVKNLSTGAEVTLYAQWREGTKPPVQSGKVYIGAESFTAKLEEFAGKDEETIKEKIIDDSKAYAHEVSDKHKISDLKDNIEVSNIEELVKGIEENKLGAYPVKLSITSLDASTTAEKTIMVTLTEDGLPPIVKGEVELVGHDFTANLSEVENLDILKESKAYANKITRDENGSVADNEPLDVVVKEEDLAKIKTATEPNSYTVELSATKDETTVSKTIIVTLTEDDIPKITKDSLEINAYDFTANLSEVENLDILKESKAYANKIIRDENGSVVDNEPLDVVVKEEDLNKIKTATEPNSYTVELSATKDETTVSKTIIVTLTKDDIPKITKDSLEINAYDFTANLSEVENLDILKESKAYANKITRDENGSVADNEPLDVVVKEEDLAKIKAATEPNSYTVELSATSDGITVSKTIIVTLTKDDIPKITKDSLEINAYDFTANLSEVENLDILKESKAYANKITRDENGSVVAIKALDVVVNEEDLGNLKALTEEKELDVRVYSIDEENTIEKTIKVKVVDDIPRISIELIAHDFNIDLDKIKDMNVEQFSNATATEYTTNAKGDPISERSLDIKIDEKDLADIKSATTIGTYKLKLSATNDVDTEEKTILVKLTKDGEEPVVVENIELYAHDFDIKQKEAIKAETEENVKAYVLEKSEAYANEIIRKDNGDLDKINPLEISINEEDLQALKESKEGTYIVHLSAKSGTNIVQKEINVTISEEVKDAEKLVEIEASDFSASIKELEKTKSLEKLILEKSKAKAFYVEKNSLGEEVKHKEIDVKINADDLDKLKATKKAGDYRIRLSAEEDGVSKETTITVKVKKPSKDKTNKKSKNNSKTGITGVAGVIALLTVASGAYISSKKK